MSQSINHDASLDFRDFVLYDESQAGLELSPSHLHPLDSHLQDPLDAREFFEQLHNQQFMKDTRSPFYEHKSLLQEVNPMNSYQQTVTSASANPSYYTLEHQHVLQNLQYSFPESLSGSAATSYPNSEADNMPRSMAHFASPQMTPSTSQDSFIQSGSNLMLPQTTPTINRAPTFSHYNHLTPSASPSTSARSIENVSPPSSTHQSPWNPHQDFQEEMAVTMATHQQLQAVSGSDWLQNDFLNPSSILLKQEPSLMQPPSSFPSPIIPSMRSPQEISGVPSPRTAPARINKHPRQSNWPYNARQRTSSVASNSPGLDYEPWQEDPNSGVLVPQGSRSSLTPGTPNASAKDMFCNSCGKSFRDLKAHQLTHQAERPEKCPIVTCEYSKKGFARKYDCQRHTLTHYKGTMVCGFCPGTGSTTEKSFNRADVFKRHLLAVHNVEQNPPNSKSRPRGSADAAPIGFVGSEGKCSTCGISFASAQQFYEHLDDCVLSKVVEEEPSAAINGHNLSSVSDADMHAMSGYEPESEVDAAFEEDEEDAEDNDDSRDATFSPAKGSGRGSSSRAPSTRSKNTSVKKNSR